jgi:hypothetical protein
MVQDGGGLEWVLRAQDKFSETTAKLIANLGAIEQRVKALRTETLKPIKIKAAVDSARKERIAADRERTQAAINEERIKAQGLKTAADQQRLEQQRLKTLTSVANVRKREVDLQQQQARAASQQAIEEQKIQQAKLRTEALQRRAVADQRRATTAVRETAKEVSALDVLGGRLSLTLRNAFSFILIFRGINAVQDAFRTLVSDGIKFNVQMQGLERSFAGIISSTSEAFKTDGTRLTAEESLQNAFRESSILLRQLRRDALTTTATVTELGTAVQNALGPGLAAGLSIDAIRKFAVNISQAATAIDLEQRQLPEEVRSFLTGNIRAATSRIATVLNVTPDDVRQARSQGGEEFERFLNESLGSFEQAALATRDQFDVALAGLQQGAEATFADGFSGVFENLRTTLVEFRNVVADEGSDGLAGIARSLGGALDGLTTKAVSFIKSISADELSNNIRNLGDIAGQLFDTVSNFLTVFGSGTGALLSTITAVASAFDSIGVNVGAIFGLVLGFKALRAVIISLIPRALILKVAMLGILSPGSALAVGALALGFLALGFSSQSAAQRMETFQRKLDATRKSARSFVDSLSSDDGAEGVISKLDQEIARVKSQLDRTPPKPTGFGFDLTERNLLQTFLSELQLIRTELATDTVLFPRNIGKEFDDLINKVRDVRLEIQAVNELGISFGLDPLSDSLASIRQGARQAAALALDEIRQLEASRGIVGSRQGAAARDQLRNAEEVAVTRALQQRIPALAQETLQLQRQNDLLAARVSLETDPRRLAFSQGLAENFASLVQTQIQAQQDIEQQTQGILTLEGLIDRNEKLEEETRLSEAQVDVLRQRADALREALRLTEELNEAATRRAGIQIDRAIEDFNLETADVRRASAQVRIELLPPSDQAIARIAASLEAELAQADIQLRDVQQARDVAQDPFERAALAERENALLESKNDLIERASVLLDRELQIRQRSVDTLQLENQELRARVNQTSRQREFLERQPLDFNLAPAQQQLRTEQDRLVDIQQQNEQTIQQQALAIERQRVAVRDTTLSYQEQILANEKLELLVQQRADLEGINAENVRRQEARVKEAQRRVDAGQFGRRVEDSLQLSFEDRLGDVAFDSFENLGTTIGQATTAAIFDSEADIRSMFASFGRSIVSELLSELARSAIRNVLSSITAASQGGRIVEMASGGMSPVHALSRRPKDPRDNIPAWLRAGELVVTPEAARDLFAYMQSPNSPRAPHALSRFMKAVAGMPNVTAPPPRGLPEFASGGSASARAGGSRVVGRQREGAPVRVVAYDRQEVDRLASGEGLGILARSIQQSQYRPLR